jgi:nicotinamidase/pyrazinamidase
MKFNEALLVVDVQNDFCPGGALGVREGDKIVSAINKYIELFSKKGLPVFATRDWHPKKTSHFKEFGGVWPTHCIQNTKGAEFHPGLRLPKEVILIYKGMDPAKDSYSAFQAEDQNGTGLPELLKVSGVEEIYIAGLATDYCVRFTTADAIKSGFKVKVLADAIKGVNLKPGDSEEAIEEMVKNGATMITLKDIENKL